VSDIGGTSEIGRPGRQIHPKGGSSSQV
jgi:hypothetical protein